MVSARSAQVLTYPGYITANLADLVAKPPLQGGDALSGSGLGLLDSSDPLSSLPLRQVDTLHPVSRSRLGPLDTVHRVPQRGAMIGNHLLLHGLDGGVTRPQAPHGDQDGSQA